MTDSTRDDQSASASGRTDLPGSRSLYRPLALVSWGIFVSTLGQTVTLGSLPLRTLLKNELHIDPTKMAVFFSLANFAWYLKPMAGFLSDTVPLFGTRRRHYLLLGSSAAAIAWLLLAAMPHTYVALVGAAIILNIFLVLVSTATGGFLVDVGKESHITGTLSSARVIALNAAVILAGVAGGWLATRRFSLTGILAAALIFSNVPLVWFLLRERPVAKIQSDVLRRAGGQIRQAVSSGGLWAAAGLLMLVHLAPGFQTALYYHMTDHLKFSPKFIGLTDSIGGVAGVVAALLYLGLCRCMNLRGAYAIAIIAAAAGAVPFVALHGKASALAICFFYKLGLNLADVASLDLAARASPRGCEATSYALMISFWNIAMAISDISGSWMYGGRLHVSFNSMIVLNAGTTLLVLIAVPFLPSRLVGGREGIGRKAAG